MLVFPGTQASDSRADGYAHTLSFRIPANLDSAILQSHGTCGYSELNETVHLASILALHVILWIKILDGCSDSRCILTDIKSLNDGDA
ncbi:hypothetical protein D1872_271960 [compost metagenome]